MIGKTINGCLIEKKIKVGRTGTVYKSIDNLLSVPRAIKIIHPQLIDRVGVRERFQLALQSWAQLDEVHFVHIFSAIATGEVLGYIMDFIEGEPLDVLLKSQKVFGISQAIDYFLQVSKAISFAHKKDIIHRKLCLSNIIVGKDQILKIVGLGALRNKNHKRVTPQNLCIGKIKYMAPEQFAGNYSIYSDQYSLGVIFYEMLTGKSPFNGKNISEICKKHLYKTPQLPSKYNSKIDSDLEKVILKSLSKSPKERYEDTDKFIEAVLETTDRMDFLSDSSVQSLMYRGRKAIESRRLENAIYFFNKVLSLYGEETQYYEEAKTKRDEAIILYNEEQDIRKMRDLYMESLEFFDEEDDDKAKEYVIKILNVMRDYPNSTRVRGIKMDIAREMPEILAEASNEIEQRIEDSKKLVNEGTIFLETEEYEGALELFTKALEEDFKNKKAIEYKILCEKKIKIAKLAQIYKDGLLDLKNQKYKGAIEKLKEVTELEKGYASAEKYLKMAEEEFEKEKSRAEEISKIYIEALGLYEKWDYEEALKKFKKVLEIDHDHKEANHFVDEVLQRLDEDNKIEEIGFFYKKGMSFYEEHKWRESITCFNRVLKYMETHKKAKEYKYIAEQELSKDEIFNKVFNEALICFRGNEYSEALKRFDYLLNLKPNHEKVIKYRDLCLECSNSSFKAK